MFFVITMLDITGNFDFGEFLNLVPPTKPAAASSSTGKSFVAVSGGVGSSTSPLGSPRNPMYQLQLVGPDSGLCLGQIGKGRNTVYINSVGVCRKDSHKSNKEESLERESLLMVKKSISAAYLSHALPAAILSVQAQEKLLQLVLLLVQDWERLFYIILGLQALVTFAESRELITLKKVQSMLNSPQKGSAYNPDISKIIPFESALSSNLNRRLTIVEEYLEDVTPIAVEFGKQESEDLQAVKQVQLANSIQVQEIQSTLGTRAGSGLPAKYGNASAWIALGMLAQDMKDMPTDMDQKIGMHGVP